MKNVVSARYNEHGWIEVIVEGMVEGSSISVPDDMGNMDRVDLEEWIGQGGVIEAFVPGEIVSPVDPVQDRLTYLEAAISVLKNDQRGLLSEEKIVEEIEVIKGPPIEEMRSPPPPDPDVE
jgi:hypothetical protein